MKLKKNQEKHIVNVSIQQCEDNDGRFFFVSVKTDGSATNKNAVWVKDYDSAMEFAQKFFEQEYETMDLDKERKFSRNR